MSTKVVNYLAFLSFFAFIPNAAAIGLAPNAGGGGGGGGSSPLGTDGGSSAELSIALEEVRGVSVAGVGQTQAVGTTSADGFIEYFIPLSQQNSGTYGVNGVGETSDYGSGGGELEVFLAFTDINPGPISSAELIFEFVDLDLVEATDRAGFYETVQFVTSDGTRTEVIDNLNDDGTNFNVNGNTVTQSISFLDATELFDFNAGNNLFLSAIFTSQSDRFGFNTPESFRATLRYGQAPTEVPEPASMLLLGCGLGGLAARRRRRQAE